MNRTLSIIVTAALLACAPLTLVTLSACAGQRARTHVLAPALVRNVDDLKADAALGATTLPDAPMQTAAAEAIARFFGAVKSGDRAAILAAMGDWTLVESLIVKGVDARVASKQLDAQTRKSFDNQREKFAQALADVVKGVN